MNITLTGQVATGIIALSAIVAIFERTDRMNIGEYPLPSYACYIWSSGDAIHVLFPPEVSNGKSHSIRIPIERIGVECNGWGQPLPSQRGLKFLLDMLNARHMDGGAKIGTASAPTQYDLDFIAKQWSGKITKIEKKKDAPEELTLEDLEIE